ncbi:MAG: protoheme IX farnesyltransferase [Candidatus Latescibacterota bacterium]|nr:MAG: protoheme IX farnesyltransferase [Candidatus Latescibacterota bacterium]
MSDFVELTKPRITTLVVMTTWMGYVVASQGAVQLGPLLHALLGTALTCGGTSALNQVWERDRDARMERTRHRPLPMGRVHPGDAMWFAVGLSLAGLAELALFVNLLTALVAGVTLATYVFAYTPLKRRTWLSTTVGAFPGALPPVIGWAAARGTLDAGAVALFAIQFIWQMPHFYAIAWMYREDYARGGFPMLSVIDEDGSLTGRQIAGWSMLLLPASLLPALLGHAGPLYAIGALLLGFVLLLLGLAVARTPELRNARRVFLASILYLPALFGLLVLDNLL